MIILILAKEIWHYETRLEMHRYTLIKIALLYGMSKLYINFFVAIDKKRSRTFSKDFYEIDT